MMNISEMTGQEKSMVLARLLKEEMFPGKYMPVMSPEFKPIDLYDSENMAWAWRVLNWANDKTLKVKDGNGFTHTISFLHRVKLNTALPPKEAQSLWLDKILELAIGAGMVEGK